MHQPTNAQSTDATKPTSKPFIDELRDAVEQDTVSPEAWKMFEALYCDPKQLTIKEAWSLVVDQAKLSGWTWLSYDACRRQLNKHIPPAVQDRYRKPAKLQLLNAASAMRIGADLASGKDKTATGVFAPMPCSCGCTVRTDIQTPLQPWIRFGGGRLADFTGTTISLQLNGRWHDYFAGGLHFARMEEYMSGDASQKLVIYFRIDDHSTIRVIGKDMEYLGDFELCRVDGKSIHTERSDAAMIKLYRQYAKAKQLIRENRYMGYVPPEQAPTLPPYMPNKPSAQFERLLCDLHEIHSYVTGSADTIPALYVSTIRGMIGAAIKRCDELAKKMDDRLARERQRQMDELIHRMHPGSKQWRHDDDQVVQFKGPFGDGQMPPVGPGYNCAGDIVMPEHPIHHTLEDCEAAVEHAIDQHNQQANAETRIGIALDMDFIRERVSMMHTALHLAAEFFVDYKSELQQCNGFQTVNHMVNCEWIAGSHLIKHLKLAGDPEKAQDLINRICERTEAIRKLAGDQAGVNRVIFESIDTCAEMAFDAAIDLAMQIGGLPDDDDELITQDPPVCVSDVSPLFDELTLPGDAPGGAA